MKDKPTKSKATSKQKSNEELKRWQLIIQDRVSGLSIKEIAELHKVDRHTIRKALDDHSKEFEEARDAFISERQDRINAIIDRHNEKLVNLLSIGAENLEGTIIVMKNLIANPDDSPFSPAEASKMLESASKAFGTVESSVMNRQKEATK